MGAGALMYGVDYPHFESCFQRNMGEVATLATTPFLGEDEIESILFDRAADLYNFDVDALRPDVERIGFEVADVGARRDELLAAIPDFDISHITGGQGGFGRRPEQK
jgi:hypothetical protein